jgi:tRNA pseudouridine synthase 10
LKSFFNKVLCRIISKKTGKKVDFVNPDLKIIYEMENDLIKIEPTSLFIYGRYIKNKRGIRQTREYCDYCKGVGCSECNYIGYSSEPSIENYILPFFKEKFNAEDSILHAAGREDIDVRTINTGRPFVVEVKRPLKRNVELKQIEEEINKNAKGDVIVKGLRRVDKDVMKKIKVLSKYEEKTYLLRVKFEKPVNKQILDFIVFQLNNRVIHQRTPTRVLYRRKDIVRYKMVYSVDYNQIDKQIVEFKILCQGGLYVKELAHGDNNRTNPSIASLANMNVEVLSLDVISISPELEKKLNLY